MKKKTNKKKGHGGNLPKAKLSTMLQDYSFKRRGHRTTTWVHVSRLTGRTGSAQSALEEIRTDPSTKLTEMDLNPHKKLKAGERIAIGWSIGKKHGNQWRKKQPRKKRPTSMRVARQKRRERINRELARQRGSEL